LAISKFLAPRADGLRAMSQGQKEKFVKSGINEKKIRVISTPVDLKKFENYGQEEKQKKLWESLAAESKGTKFVLMVGRKDLVKDFSTLFKTINLVYKKNPEAGLWLVGNHTSYDEIKNELELPPEKVRLTGRVDSDDLAAYYKASYLTVLSSTSESFGKVLVEANACGKPVVSTATTGAKEIVYDGENGFLAPIGDYKELAEKIIYLLENPETAKRMGENGRRLVSEKYGDNTKKIVAFWQDIINN
ncbi:MAG: glycosyltransferase family 4 protein, partial [Patescibacteria group bacterium]